MDRILELDRLGWEGWVGSKWMVGGGFFEFPPPQRVLSPRPRDQLIRWLRASRLEPWWWLERPIRRVHPVLIHAHFGWTAAEAIGAAESHGLPLVAGFHGYDATVYPRYGFDVPNERRDGVAPEDVYSELFSKAAAVLATSRFIAEKVRELGCAREVEVVHSGIRLEWFPYRGPRPGEAEEALRLLFVGRLVAYKGLDVALKAMDLLVTDYRTDATLTVIGDGPFRESCESLTEELGIADRVEFRGELPRPAVLEGLRGADILLVPSRTKETGQAEGLGNVVKEALAVGLEVAVSDNGGLREAMPPDRHEELVPENDPDALAARLHEIHGLRPRWAERAQEGRRFVEENFDWSELAQKLDDVYRRVAARSPAPPADRASS